MSLRAALAEGTEQLAAAGIETARLDARVLMGAVLGTPPASVPALSCALSEPQQAQFDDLIRRRTRREPVAYILGHKEFWSLEFAVGPGVLVPRPDSETLIEAARASFADQDGPRTIADLGCGSGCLIIAALHLWPRAHGTAFDISAAALDYTRKNAERLGVAGRLDLVLCDFRQAEGAFDLVLCNPPYLREEELAQAAPELSFEPAQALSAGADGLSAYRALGPVFGRIVHPEGLAVVELGAGQEGLVCREFSRAGLDVTGVRTDLSGIPRALLTRPARKKVVGIRGPRG